MEIERVQHQMQSSNMIIIDIVNSTFYDCFDKQNEFGSNILYTIFYVPKCFYWCKIVNFCGEKLGDEAMFHEVGL